MANSIQKVLGIAFFFQNPLKTGVKNKNKTKQKASLRISEDMKQLTRNLATSLFKKKKKEVLQDPYR